MAVQGFFSPDKKTRMAGDKENNAAFNVKVEPVKVANNINQYNEQTPSLDYAPDRVGEYIKESEIKSYTTEKDTGYGASLEKSIDNLSSVGKGIYGIEKKFNEYGVPMSDEEKRVTAAYELTNLKFPFKDSYKFSDTNYANIQSDYAKYKDLRERRDTRREAEEAVNKFRSDAYADFERADYAIKMKQYNLDGTEKDINKYNQTLDQQMADLKRVNRANEDLVDMSKRYPSYYKENFSDDGLYGLSRFGRVVPQKDIDAYEKKVAAEEAERTRLSSLKAKRDYEESQKNIFQKIGDTVGNVFNKLTGTLPAQGDTLQAQGINTGATVNLSQVGNVSETVQAARDAVAKANLRKSGLDKTVGGQSSQANYGRASKGFGTGTHGKGRPSNPGSQRQTGVGVSAGNLSRHKAGHSSSQPSSSRSRSQGRGGRRGGSTGGSGSSRKGGTGTGGSRAKSSGSRGQGGGTASRSKGGSFGGSRRSTNRSKSRRRCDIRTKINISPLINSNLVKDNLAEVAYFVQEIRN